MEFIFPLIWMLGVTFPMDEMAVNSKFHHMEIIWIMYKAEGDGLWTDVVFQKGYTYQIFMCNDPMLKTYLVKRMLPLDTILVEIFDTV